MEQNYSKGTQHTIPARSSVAVILNTDSTIKIINTHGKQVIDFWSFSQSTLTTYLSMSHTRTATLHLWPKKGDKLVTNTREPILEFIEDTTSGIHDSLIAACDINRYHQLGVPKNEYHANCADNLKDALTKDINQTMPEGMKTGPDPFNLFMNVPVTKENGLNFGIPESEKGQYVIFKALIPCIVVMSACPQDLIKINDTGPVEAHFVVS